MRAAIVTESFLPHVNGVTGSVLQILAHLERTGHEAVVIAPGAKGVPERVHGAQVRTVPSVGLPGYRNVRVGATGSGRIRRVLAEFEPDVVHLASPFALGWRGLTAARALELPVVAAYQTDVAAYAERYRVAATAGVVQRHIARLHAGATLTLAPSSASEQRLADLGVDRLRRWVRGVDARRFHPSRRDAHWLRPRGDEVLVGYVGRLAAEKQVEDLRVLNGLPGVRLVVVGEGPARRALEDELVGAVFLGRLDGDALAAAMASLDVFVHPGESETFGQTLQEAHASGVPIVATGARGPLDLVRPGQDGWLYRPGDLADLRMRVLDLTGDRAKRRAFGEAGRAAVESRSWSAVCGSLVELFGEAIVLHDLDSRSRGRRARRAELPAPVASSPRRTYVALGDSLTEGLCDPGPDGSLRGWADRLALLLAAGGALDYANLAVRSRRVRDVCGPQLQRARELRPDLVSILVGANDLVRPRVDVGVLIASLEAAVTTLREDGADVLLVTPFLPGRRAAGVYARRFAAFAAGLVGVAERTGAILLDTDLHPDLAAAQHWGEDLVHLSTAGHRFLAYRAADRLGVPHAQTLGAMDEDYHAHVTRLSRVAWWRQHALPWVWRRVRGRVAGDGRVAKHDALVKLARSAHPVHLGGVTSAGNERIAKQLGHAGS